MSQNCGRFSQQSDFLGWIYRYTRRTFGAGHQLRTKLDVTWMRPNNYEVVCAVDVFGVWVNLVAEAKTVVVIKRQVWDVFRSATGIDVIWEKRVRRKHEQREVRRRYFVVPFPLFMLAKYLMQAMQRAYNELCTETL